MRLPCLQFWLFAAVLTVGTASANSIQFTLNVGSTGTQSATQTVSLAIDGNAINPMNGNGWAFAASQNLTTGWHNIAIDYNSIAGTNYLALLVNSDGVPVNYLASYDASGNTINGLTGTYFVGGTNVLTKYGEGPIYDGSPGGSGYEIYNGNPGLWGGMFAASSTFEEKLTGFLYVGTGTPKLSDVPLSPSGSSDTSGSSGTSGSSDSSGGAVPEPEALWLISAAVPLLVFSKLRIRAKRTGQ